MNKKYWLIPLLIAMVLLTVFCASATVDDAIVSLSYNNDSAVLQNDGSKTIVISTTADRVNVDGDNYAYEYVNADDSDRQSITTSLTEVSGSTNFSVSFWFNVDRPSDSHVIEYMFFRMAGSTNRVGVGIVNYTADNEIRLSAFVYNGVTHGRGFIGYQDETDPFNSWHHLVMTYNASATTIVAYLDTVVAPDEYYMGGGAAGPNTIIGNAVADERGVDGRIDQVMIYDRILSTAEVAVLYDSGTEGYNPYDPLSTSSAPVINTSTFLYSDTTGDTSLLFGESMDYLKVNITDLDSVNDMVVTLSLTDPDGVIKLDNVTMSNVSGNVTYVYSTDFLLDAIGNWTATINATDNTSLSVQEDFVFYVNVSTSITTGRLFAYDMGFYTDYADIESLEDSFDFNAVEIHFNKTTLTSNWVAFKSVVNDAKTNGSTIVLTYDDDLSNSTITISSMNTKLDDLVTGDYLNAILMIKINPLTATNTSGNVTILNAIAKKIFQETSNKFPIYVKDLVSSSINTNYVKEDIYSYIETNDRSDYVDSEMSLFHSSSVTSRFYVNLTDSFKGYALDFQNSIIERLRSGVNSSTTLATNFGELNNLDFIVSNNGSSVSDVGVSLNAASNGFDIYDLTDKEVVELSNDGSFSVSVPAYSANMVYVDNLTKLIVNGDNSIKLYGMGTDLGAETDSFGAGGSNAFLFVSGSTNPDDGRIFLTDPTFEDAGFIVWYGTNNYEAIGSWSRYDKSILADNTNSSWINGLISQTEVYGYNSVSSYGDNNYPSGCTSGVDCTVWNRSYWLEVKEDGIDVWTDINVSVNIFIDGLDIGSVNDVDGLFGASLIDLVDYVKITKERSVGLNTYTDYEAYANLGNWTMRESACGRWGGTESVPTYTYESIALEKARASFHTSHGIPVLAQVFGDITDYKKAHYCFMQTKVLYGDLAEVSYNQPLFDYTGATDDFTWNYYKYPVLGDALENDYSEVGSDVLTRRFENGLVSVNTTSKAVTFSNDLVVNNLSFCAYFYDNDDGVNDEGYMHFVINDDLSESFDIVDTDLAAFSKTKKCVDFKDFYQPSGWYELEFYYIDSDANYVGNAGIYMYHDTNTSQDKLSSWEQTLNDHPSNDESNYWQFNTGDNWQSSFYVDTDSSKLIDTVTSVVDRSDSLVGSRCTVNYSVLSDWDLDTFDVALSVTADEFVGIYVGSDLLTSYLDSDCSGDSPTFNSTTVGGEVWDSCYYTVGSTHTGRVTLPLLNSSLSNEYTIFGNNYPVVSSSSILPSLVSLGDNLTGYCAASDSDSDNVTFYFEWFKNSVSDSSGYFSNSSSPSTSVLVSTINSSAVVVGDKWILSCLANDGYSNSSVWKNSSEVGLFVSIDLLDSYALNSSDGCIDGFNTSNLESIERLRLVYNVSSAVALDSWYWNFTAGGLDACARGNKQVGVCYNFNNTNGSHRWISFVNGSETVTFDGRGDYNVQGDGVTVSLNKVSSTNWLLNLTVDEHYNPNILKAYGSLFNFSDFKYQDGSDQVIHQNNYFKMSRLVSDIPFSVLPDILKVDVRVNYTTGVKIPTQPLEMWACHSYVGGDPSTSVNCSELCSKLPSEFQDDGTKFRCVQTTDFLSELGSLPTDIVLRTDEVHPLKYYSVKTYKATAVGYSPLWEFSTDSGSSWSGLGDGYESELNINWFNDGSDPTSLIHSLSFTTISGVTNSLQSNLSWVIDPNKNYPPVISMTGLVDGEVFQTNKTIVGAVRDPNGDTFNVLLSLLNLDGSLNITLRNGTATNANTSSFVFNDSLPRGVFNFTILASDNQTPSLTDSRDFLIEIVDYFNINISTVTVSPLAPTVVQDVLGYVTVDFNNSATMNASYVWYVNSVANETGFVYNLTAVVDGAVLVDTLDSSVTSVGDVVVFGVNVSDEFTNSGFSNSSSVTVVIVPPVVVGGGGGAAPVPVVDIFTGSIEVVEEDGKVLCDALFVPEFLGLGQDGFVDFSIENNEAFGIGFIFDYDFAEDVPLRVVGDNFVNSGNTNSYSLKLSNLFNDDLQQNGFLNISSDKCFTVRIPVSINYEEEKIPFFNILGDVLSEGNDIGSESIGSTSFRWWVVFGVFLLIFVVIGVRLFTKDVLERTMLNWVMVVVGIISVPIILTLLLRLLFR